MNLKHVNLKDISTLILPKFSFNTLRPKKKTDFTQEDLI